MHVGDCIHDAGRCDPNELRQPLSCSQHHEQSRSAGQLATFLLAIVVSIKQAQASCIDFSAPVPLLALPQAVLLWASSQLVNVNLFVVLLQSTLEPVS